MPRQIKFICKLFTFCLILLTPQLSRPEINNLQANYLHENTNSIDIELEFISPENLEYTTKAGGNVTTAQDFSGANIIVKTANTTTGVTGSGITIDSNNKISGANILNATCISFPASTPSNPSVKFPGASTNTGIYSAAQDTVSISIAGTDVIDFSATGITIAPSKTLTVNSPATFNVATTFATGTTFSGTTNITGKTTFNGTTNLNSTTDISGKTTINGSINLNGQTTIINNGSIILATGSQTNPALKFYGSTGTGIYSSGSGNVSIATNNSQQLSVSPGSISIPTGIISVPLGSQTNPTYTFNGSTGSGIYSPTVGQVAISAQGAQRILFATGAITIAANNALTLPTGTGANPSIKFTGLATNTGIYASSNPDKISIGINGTETFTIDSTGGSLNGTTNLNGPTNINGALNFGYQTIPAFTSNSGSFNLADYPNSTVFMMSNTSGVDCFVNCDISSCVVGRVITFCNTGNYSGNTGRIILHTNNSGTQGFLNYGAFGGYTPACILYANPTGGATSNGKSSASFIAILGGGLLLPISGTVLAN